MREYKTIGSAMTARSKLDAKVTVAAKALDAFKEERDELDRRIGELLKASGSDKVTANGLIASWQTTLITEADDWDKLRPYVSRTGNWQILYRRLNMKACEELLATRKKVRVKGSKEPAKPLAIPGTSYSEITKIKIAKSPR